MLRRALLGALLAMGALASAAGAFAGLPVPVSSQVGGATLYPAWPVLTAELQDMAAQHPDILRLHSAGQSAKGLDLWVMEVADFENPAKAPLEQREVLWVDGGTHANEYSGVMFVLHLLRWLAEGYGQNETATWIVANRHTFIMPLLNPEGSMNGIGRLNDNLVNINRNYPVGWGDVDESPVVNNPGPYPASEAETQAIIGWWQRVRPDYMASVHCCGNLWLYPYGTEGRDPHPDDGPVFARICDEAYAEVREDCGPIWSTIYPASGNSADAAYELAGSVAFGFEMSGREALLLWGHPFTAGDIEETESESWRGLMHAFLNVERYGAFPVPGVEAVAQDTVSLAVENQGWGNLTRATLALADARGVVHSVALPRLGPAERASIVVPGTFGPGSFPLHISYQKRPFATDGLLAHTLGVARTAAGLVAGLDAEPLQPSSILEARTPLPAGLALVALAAVALAARRR